MALQAGLAVNRLQRKPQKTVQLHHTKNDLQRMAPGVVVRGGKHDQKAQRAVDESCDDLHSMSAALQHAIVIAITEVCIGSRRDTC